MAALDLQEQEQFEALKAWWQENRNFILGVMVVALVAVAAWRGWTYYHYKQASEAGALYEQFLMQMDSRDAKRINDAAAAVMDKYGSTGYAPRAALLAAQANEQFKDAPRAKTQLQWVIDHADDSGLKNVARLRLAAMLLDEKNYDGALKALDAAHPASFDVLYADLKGDILNAQGKPAEARAAYRLAYEKSSDRSAYRGVIQMKLDALGEGK